MNSTVKVATVMILAIVIASIAFMGTMDGLTEDDPVETHDVGDYSYIIQYSWTIVTGFSSDASNKTDVNIPSSVTIDGKDYRVDSIQVGAFKDETSITSVTITGNVKVFSTTFEGCTSLETVTLDEGVDDSTGAFNNCPKITSYTHGTKAYVGSEGVLVDSGGTVVMTTCADGADITIPTSVGKILPSK